MSQTAPAREQPRPQQVVTLRYQRGPSSPPLKDLRLSVPEGTARASRLHSPPVSAFQCKPWLDAATLGVHLPYSYDSRLFVEVANGQLAVTYEGARSRRPTVSQFAPSHFGLATGYRLRTDPGFNVLIDRPRTQDGHSAYLVPGLVETWWYPKPIFVVYEFPQPGRPLEFCPGDLLALLLVVPAGRQPVRELDPAEAAQLQVEESRYDDYLANNPQLRWQSLGDSGFSHAYRHYSRLVSPNSGKGDSDERAS